MWFPLRVKEFVAKKTINDDFCTVFLSDFKHIWCRSFQNNELFSIAKALNPLFEASDQKLKEISLGLLEENENISKKIEEEENDLRLTLESCSLGVKFLFEFTLRKGNEEMFYNEFILPLLLVIVKVHNREKNFIKIIREKDMEIENYQQKLNEFSKKSKATSFIDENECNKFLNSIAAKIIDNPSNFLDCIDKKILFNEIQPIIKEDEGLLINDLSEQCQSQSIESKSKIKSDVINQYKNLNQSVKLDHQSIRRRHKKDKGSFKI